MNPTQAILEFSREWRMRARQRPWLWITGALFLSVILLTIVAPLLPLPLRYRARIADVLLLCVIASVIALALNVVTGYTGLLDLGIVAFASIGAYTATILYDRPWMQFPGSFLIVLMVGGLHAAAWGLIRGAPTLRLSDDYYAIVTFAFAEIVRIFIRNEGWLTGGGNGFKNFPVLNPYGARLVDGTYAGILKTRGYWEYPRGAPWHGGTWQFYYLSLLLLIVTIVVMRRLEMSRVGRAWFAIKADETSAATSGIDLARYKMNAFAISAFFAGVGGAFLGFKMNTVSTNVFDFWFSVVVLCGVVLGGLGSISGTIAGTFIVYGLGEVLREQLRIGDLVLKVDDRARFLMFGALLVGVMVFRPQGLLVRHRARRRAPEEITPTHDLYHLGSGER